MEKRWLSIPGYEHGYEVSDSGEVRSLFRGNRLLRPASDKQGYQRVMLYDESGKQAKGYVVHRLVAIAFLTNPLGLPWVNHKNGIKQDNSLANLEWCDRAGNVRHAVECGLLKPHANIVLSERERKVVVQLCEIGFAKIAIAKMFEASELEIGKIIASCHC